MKHLNGITKVLCITLVNSFFSYTITPVTEARLLRFPSTNDKEVVFTYAGNLYTVPISGGRACKLTSHIGYEMFPRYSPDGAFIAFTGQYDGNTEVYSIPAQGGVPKRLTYTASLSRDDVADRMGPNNIVMCWTPDGKNIIYRSRWYSFNSFVGHLHSVAAKGGMFKELPLAEGGFCSFSPDGKKMAFNRVFREFRTWKYYQGGMADDIWIYDTETHKIENITNNPHQDIIPMWHKNKIYFLSDRDRTMNLFVYNIETATIQKITNFTDYDIKFPSISNEHIVFEKGGYIYLYSLSTGNIKKMSIEIYDDNIYSRREIIPVDKKITDADLSPNGERVVFVARGEIFNIPVKKGVSKNLSQSPGVHERDVAWSPNGTYIAYVSDKTGEFEIYISHHESLQNAVLLTRNADTYKFHIKWSPDSKKILWTDRKLRLQYVDIETKKTTLVATAGTEIINYFDWSPDSKWIAYSKKTEDKSESAFLYHTETRQTHRLTDYWYNAEWPSFSSDGKYLFFISSRDFSPLYSQIEWNYAYVDMQRIYFVLLSKNTPSPFAPENPMINEQPKKEENNIFTIDLDGIEQRIVGLPIKASNYTNVIAVDNKIYYYEKSAHAEKMTFKMYDLQKKQETDLGENIFFTLSGNKNKMLIRQGTQYSVIDLPTGKINTSEYIDLSDMKIYTDYRAEWQQIFDESWRQMRDFFYVENMHGVDWNAIREKYAVFVPHVNHRDDLTYIIGEMIGELNVGHAYVNSGERPEVQKISTGLLGATFSKHASGYFIIDNIMQGANWNKSLRSPLTEPGAEVQPHEFILAINGTSCKDVDNIYSLLVNTAGTLIELTVNSKPDLAGSRNILVTPIEDESALCYYSWVQNNIRKVNEASQGEIGYIHIPDMSPAGLNQFVSLFYPQLNKKGLIIDNRGNGGGNVSPMIIERLRREITRAKMSRNSIEGSSSPSEAFSGPMVMLIDKYSASDGDLFPYGFRKHNLGTIIGTRTWGGVIGISGSLPFIDGSNLRKPEFASYSAEKSEWIIEGYGVDPDIVIDNDPYQEYMGYDAQLNKALEIILKKIKTEYKAIPPIPTPPNKAK